ncbi:hypothetical protein O6H91_02G111800 [Diphasiastrum complanatum]|uniref:Uncharacterized protein n=2 Tax=Diphasiastrum complanatum TaxID=34168 RepID=A0ACC2EJG9_DIPCM|nr:hypothetical protein O6H91_02G111800 [Diphasiastrum complanatum]KAJ7566629.1 hypothetical protein O6H91_02G111800 [Diphasiastrum complanatum]
MAYPGKRRKDGYGEDDVRENVKAPRLWMVNDDPDADCITSVNYNGLNIDHWMRLHQKGEAAASSMPVASFQQRAITSAMALQDIPNIDPTRPPVFQAQAQAQAQSATQLQSVKLSLQQQQKLQQQQLHKQFQQQQFQQQQHQLQQQQLQQQHIQRLLQQQDGVPDCFGSLMERSSICSPTPIVIPSNLRTSQQLYGDLDLQNALSAAPSCSYPVQNSCISRPQSSSSLISDAGNDQTSSLLSNKHSEAQHPSGNLATTGILVQEPQMAASWLPSSSRDPSTADAQLMIPYSFAGKFDAPSGPGCTFSSSLNEQTDQLGFSSLPLQQSTAVYRSSLKEQEQVQSELILPSTVLPAAPSMVSVDESDPSGMVSRMINQLMPQNQMVYGKQLLSGCYNASAADPSTSLNTVVNGSCVGEGEIPHQSLPAAPPRRATTRTYTKVYKLGSIGRALDVNRFKNYTELRCELARMFGLEGQLDKKSGWQLVFIDNENDILLVGDDPWEEFVSSVRGIRILSPSEVAYYMNSDERVGAPYNCLNSSVMRRF